LRMVTCRLRGIYVAVCRIGADHCRGWSMVRYTVSLVSLVLYHYRNDTAYKHQNHDDRDNNERNFRTVTHVTLKFTITRGSALERLDSSILTVPKLPCFETVDINRGFLVVNTGQKT
jgi:hypothetical protein